MYQILFLWISSRQISVSTAQCNQHRIRKYRSAEARGGRPGVLFFLPHLTNSEDQKKGIDREDYHWAVNMQKKLHNIDALIVFLNWQLL